jgi:hypothetical protein
MADTKISALPASTTPLAGAVTDIVVTNVDAGNNLFGFAITYQVD